MSELKNILKEIDVADSTITYSRYLRWNDQFGDDPLPEDQVGKLSMTADEIREVAELATQKQLKEDDGATYIEEEHVLVALSEKGFCQTFEMEVGNIAEMALYPYRNRGTRAR